MRLALRQLGQSPGFTIVAVGTLALGIAASTAIFSVVQALLLAPLHYRDPGSLVQIHARHPRNGLAGLAPATFADLRAESSPFATLAVRNFGFANLTPIGPPVQVQSGLVSARYFAVLGVAPLLGRTWTDEEALTGAAPVVVLGQRLWEQHYGADRTLVGRTILINETAHTVLGVMPAGFRDLDLGVALWQPVSFDDAARRNRTNAYLGVIGRLRDGVTLVQANAELAATARRLEVAHGTPYREWTLEAIDLRTRIVGPVQRGLLLLAGAVGCVMLVTCANLAGLTLVRTTGRLRELAIRSALGASRSLLVRQLLTESLLVALAGGAAGVLLGEAGLRVVLASLPAGWLPLAENISLNAPVLIGALALTLLTALAVGLVPGLAASRVRPDDALKEGARGSSSSRAARRIWSGLIVSQIALALLLLIGAGVLGRSFLTVLGREPGIAAAQVLSLQLSATSRRYDSAAKRWDLYSRVQREVATVPGVQSADFTQTTPFRWGSRTTFSVLGESAADAAGGWSCYYDSVGADYFKTVGVPLLSGRSFTPGDDASAPAVVVISAATARRCFGTGDPLGRRLTTPAPGGDLPVEIVGVVGDIRRNGLTDELPLQVYRPLGQRPLGVATLMVRTALPPAGLTAAVQEAIWRIDPHLPVSDIAVMDTVVAATITQPRLQLELFGVFAVFAALLTAIGLHSVIAFSVAQRTREFGIRLALGASPREVLLLVTREAGRLIAAGLALGLGAALIAARVLESMIYETSARDPVVFIAVPVLLAGVAWFASWLPARRAMQVDPNSALRAE